MTQIDLDGRWVDSAAGLVDIHHDHEASEHSELYEAAEEQYTERGGRGMWTSLIGDNDHYLGTTFHVQQVNTEARVYINQFDISLDVLQIVDAAGQVIETIDIDHGDFDQIRAMLLETYNIVINARPEIEVHTSAKILTKANLGETVLLEASEFFADHDVVHGGAHNPDASLHSSLMFIAHDETLPWLNLRSDGLLEITNLSAIASGTYQTYVTVSDGAGMLEGVPITISIDPIVTIGEQSYSPDTNIQVTFEQSLSGAISLYGQVYDDAGNALSGLESLAVRVGDSTGTPEGIAVDNIDAMLANPSDHGTMQFFAYFHSAQEMVMLDLENQGGDQYALRHDGQMLATFVIGGEASDSTIDQFYISAIQDSIIGLSLAPQSPDIVAKETGHAHKVLLDTSVFSETLHQGGFGLLLVDLKTGHAVDPTTGVQIEDALITVESIGDYAVYTAETPRDGQNSVNATLLLDAQLNLNNLAFLPYYVADLPEGKTLFFGMGTGADGEASQIVQAGKNIFAVEEVLGGDADFDDLMVRVDAMQVFHSDEAVDANDTSIAFDTGDVESLFADVTGFDYINGGQGFALSVGENRELFLNMERVQFQDRTANEYELRGSFAPTIGFSAVRDGVQISTTPTYFTGEAFLNLHYQLIDTNANMEVAGSRLNDFIALQGEGNKSVSGGVGDDVMDGGQGTAVLSGGLGRDTFFLDGRSAGSVSSTVADFEVGQDRFTVWGWQTGLSRVIATEAPGANSTDFSLTLTFENLLSSQSTEDSSAPSLQAVTLRGLKLSDFGVTNIAELNAQIVSGSHAHFQTGTTVDAYGEHGYLSLS
jgi:Ca2+-binding RTX toxin-like protein